MRLEAAWLAAVAALAGLVLTAGVAVAQEPTLGIDADPAGNTATSLGTTDRCISVGEGDTFQMDLFVTDVSGLKAWEAYFTFDGDIVSVTDADVHMFQNANAGSDIFDVSESLPSTGGLYRLGAIELGDAAASDSGSGVLARLTLTAERPGLSPGILTVLDDNNDGQVDLGPRLSNINEQSLGDSNGDTFFDGPLYGSQIAVDRDCPDAASPTPAATPTSETTSPTAAPSPSASPVGVESPVATGTSTPTAAATETATTTTATTTATVAPSSPTPDPNNDSGDSGTDWSSPGLIAAYVVVGIVAVLGTIGLAFVVSGRRRGGG